MGKQTKKHLNLYMLLAFVFIIASLGIATSKLSTIPPEYTVMAITLLLGAMGAMQCVSLQKRQEQLDTLKGSLEKFKLDRADNN